MKKQIEAGQYPGIVKTTLDGVNQIDYLAGRSEKSARDTFFYYSSKHPSAVRYKNWKMYFAIAPETPTGFISPGVQTQFVAGMVNLKRDPFEMGMGEWKKYELGMGGALAGPVTSYIYDWNLLPIGQTLWLKELETYKAVSPPSGCGELQPGSGHGRAQEGTDAPEPVARMLAGDAGAPRGARFASESFRAGTSLLRFGKFRSAFAPARTRHWEFPMPSTFAIRQMAFGKFA